MIERDAGTEAGQRDRGRWPGGNVVKPESCSVLLIEDNPGDARLVREMLSEVPGGAFHLETANTLSCGLARLAAGVVDVVLLDLMLPDSRGLEGIEAIHAQAPRVPVVVLTGLIDEDLPPASCRAGAFGHLVKGEVDGRALSAALRAASVLNQGTRSN